MCACADVLNIKYRYFKMFLLILRSELQTFIKKFQPVLKYKQNTDYISKKWNISTKGNVHSLLSLSKSLLIPLHHENAPTEFLSLQ